MTTPGALEPLQNHIRFLRRHRVRKVMIATALSVTGAVAGALAVLRLRLSIGYPPERAE